MSAPLRARIRALLLLPRALRRTPEPHIEKYGGSRTFACSWRMADTKALHWLSRASWPHLQPRNPPMGATHVTEWIDNYRRRLNAERLARQAPAVQQTAKLILDELKDVERYLYWSLDPEDNQDQGAYNVMNLIDHAHALVDLGHAWRAVLKDNPPPKEDDQACA